MQETLWDTNKCGTPGNIHNTKVTNTVARLKHKGAMKTHHKEATVRFMKPENKMSSSVNLST